MSTERQEQQGTIASQLDALARWAREQDHDVVDAYICVDDGYSGSRLDRPGLDRLRDGAEAGAFEAALVLCPDRLARKYAYQILILEELERFGVQVIFLDQPLSDDPQARLLTQIQGAVAEYERIKIAVIESDSPICFPLCNIRRRRSHPDLQTAAAHQEAAIHRDYSQSYSRRCSPIAQ